MSEIYIYKYLFQNGKKILSAWMLFTVRGSVKSIQFIDSTLYAVTVFNQQLILEKCRLEEGHEDSEGFTTHLDRRVKFILGQGASTITMPYSVGYNENIEVYTTDGLSLPCTANGTTVTLLSPLVEPTTVYVGLSYDMKYTFSSQIFKGKTESGTSPSNAAKLMIRNGSLSYDKTSYFKVKVTPIERDTYENEFVPDVVGSSVIGSLKLESGMFRFPVFTKSDDVEITIENNTPLPSNFQSAEFESFVHPRSNRYG